MLALAKQGVLLIWVFNKAQINEGRLIQLQLNNANQNDKWKFTNPMDSIPQIRVFNKGIHKRDLSLNRVSKYIMLDNVGTMFKYVSSFLDTWILYECLVSPFPPFHDYQKYIPFKCTPRFSSLVSLYHRTKVPSLNLTCIQVSKYPENLTRT